MLPLPAPWPYPTPATRDLKAASGWGCSPGIGGDLSPEEGKGFAKVEVDRTKEFWHPAWPLNLPLTCRDKITLVASAERWDPETGLLYSKGSVKVQVTTQAWYGHL